MVPAGRGVPNHTELYADAAAPLGRPIVGGDWDELRLEILCDLGDDRELAGALVTLGTIRARQGRMLDAVDSFARGLAQLRRLGDRAGEAETLTALGLAFAAQRRHTAATACWMLSLTLLRELGDRAGQARLLRRLGASYLRRRRWRHAAAAYARSLALAPAAGPGRGRPPARDGGRDPLVASGARVPG